MKGPVFPCGLLLFYLLFLGWWKEYVTALKSVVNRNNISLLIAIIFSQCAIAQESRENCLLQPFEIRRRLLCQDLRTLLKNVFFVIVIRNGEGRPLKAWILIAKFLGLHVWLKTMASWFFNWCLSSFSLMTQRRPHDHKFMLMAPLNRGFCFRSFKSRDYHIIKPKLDLSTKITFKKLLCSRNKAVFMYLHVCW